MWVFECYLIIQPLFIQYLVLHQMDGPTLETKEDFLNEWEEISEAPFSGFTTRARISDRFSTQLMVGRRLFTRNLDHESCFQLHYCISKQISRHSENQHQSNLNYVIICNHVLPERPTWGCPLAHPSSPQPGDHSQGTSVEAAYEIYQARCHRW